MCERNDRKTEHLHAKFIDVGQELIKESAEPCAINVYVLIGYGDEKHLSEICL